MSVESEAEIRFTLTERETAVLVGILESAALRLPEGYEPVFGDYDSNVADSFAAHIRRQAGLVD